MVGSFEIIIGPMFSGKTEELIRRLKRHEIRRRHAHLFAPINSKGRYGGEGEWRSLGGLSYGDVSFVGEDDEGIIALVNETLTKGFDIIGIDEIQFFTLGNEEPPLIVDAIRLLNEHGIDIIAAGLNMDFRGEPFGKMGYLIAIADKITQLTAVCDICGKEAYYTQRLLNGKPAPYDSPLIMIGARETYQARCKDHHEVPNKRINRLQNHQMRI